MVNLENIFLIFFPDSRLEKVALHDIDISLNDGEVTSILGHNGSGRSTLLRLLAGHMSPNFGRLVMDGVDITDHSISQRAEYFSTVFYEENTSTAGNLTVLENLVVASRHHQSCSALINAYDDAVRESFRQQLQQLNFMEMEELMDEKVRDIPAHYRQVLALLIAVLKGTKVLLIDEHSTGLSSEVAQELLLVTENIIKSNRITTLMCISDPLFAAKISDKIIVLDHGQVVASYGKEEIKNMTAKNIHEFIPLVGVQR
ncbi:MAG: ATP-binding cassette domain-containing protein [Holosporaceae bacterium]|jgi:putative ABC transport system ATP-binding protein|nr:ATP-binding cassette domain-containing protein [Holosporaceae bacterium]